MTGSILAYNRGYNAYDYKNASFSILYSDLYSPPDQESHNLETLDPTTATVEPGFLSYNADGLPLDLHIATTSLLIDAGDPALTDPDASRADIGMYSGTSAGDFDLDGDGAPDYFWPGIIEDAPEGFDPADYDCDDLDPSIQRCP